MSYKRFIANTPVALTDGTTITWDFSQGNIGTITIGGNRTLAISNIVANSFGQLVLKQDATGSRTLTLPTGSLKDSIYALSTAANSVDILSFYYDGTNYFWTSSKAFA